jgi:hypothetical protein
MLRICLLFFLGATAAVYADPNLSFRIGGRHYQLSGAQAVMTTKHGKLQLVIAARDTTKKSMFAITAELPQNAFDAVQEVSAEFHPVSLVIMNTKGVYSLAPHVTLARDDFIRYTKKEQFTTDQMEDDPDDRPENRIPDCQKNTINNTAEQKSANRFSDACERLRMQNRRKRKKVLARYTKHAPSWINKSRAERIASADGVMRENKYQDTMFVLRLTPVKAGGKLTGISGTFSGIVVYNQGMSPAVKTPLQNGSFSVQVAHGQ